MSRLRRFFMGLGWAASRPFVWFAMLWTPAVVYNLCLLGAVSAIAAGVYLQFGLSNALLASGGLVLFLTLYAIERVMRARPVPPAEAR